MATETLPPVRLYSQVIMSCKARALEESVKPSNVAMDHQRRMPERSEPRE